MQDREKIRQLFERYRQGQCTPEEQARLHTWFNHHTQHDAGGLEELRSIYETEKTGLRRRKFLWLPYAAALFIAGLIGVWYLHDGLRTQSKAEATTPKSNDVAPGGNRAILTLADGRVVNLSEAQNGIVVGEGITYLDGTTVVGEQENKSADGHPLTRLLTLSTPKGGTYRITLSDGTQIWLNAASTLKYPERFFGNERVVEIEGEAYFSVAKDASKPFKVISSGQEITVVGTQFNISAYIDDTEMKTTLVEGAVRLQVESSGEHIALLPGEQGVLTRGNLRKRSVDPTSSVAWKNGDFYFDNTPFVDMMKQIERWYNVEIVYEREVPEDKFSGSMSRDVMLQTVLQLLTVSEIKYSLSDKKLIIE